MTIRTYNLKIFEFVVLMVSITMMNAKNFRMCFISTFRTFCELYSSPYHRPVYSLPRHTYKFFHLRFISTLLGTKLIACSIFNSFIKKFSTIKAFICFRIIPICASTFRRTKLWNLNITNFFKNELFLAKNTFYFNILNSCCIFFETKTPSTLKRTEFFLCPRFINRKLLSATFACFYNARPFFNRSPSPAFNITGPAAKFLYFLVRTKLFFTYLAYFNHGNCLSHYNICCQQE